MTTPESEPLAAVVVETPLGWAGVNLSSRGIPHATLFHRTRDAAEGELHARVLRRAAEGIVEGANGAVELAAAGLGERDGHDARDLLVERRQRLELAHLVHRPAHRPEEIGQLLARREQRGLQREGLLQRFDGGLEVLRVPIDHAEQVMRLGERAVPGDGALERRDGRRRSPRAIAGEREGVEHAGIFVLEACGGLFVPRGSLGRVAAFVEECCEGDERLRRVRFEPGSFLEVAHGLTVAPEGAVGQAASEERHHRVRAPGERGREGLDGRIVIARLKRRLAALDELAILAFTLELLYDGDAGSHEPDEHDGGQKPFHESILRLGTSRAERGLTR